MTANKKTQEKKFTVSVFTEHSPGMLQRVSAIFTRRKLNIESITASESEIEQLYRYTITLTTTEKMAKKVVDQLEKQVEIIKALVNEDDEIIHQEIALYKISTKCLKEGISIEDMVRNVNARILAVRSNFIVLEKTGHPKETQKLYNRLLPYGIMEFARSGRVALRCSMKGLATYIDEVESRYTKKDKSKSQS